MNSHGVKVSGRLGVVFFITLAAAGLSAAPARDGDPVLIGSKWKGTVTQKGTFAGGGEGPPAFEAVLTVTKREGDTFEAELWERSGEIRLTYLVKGEIGRTAHGKGYTVAFKSVSAKDVSNTSPILGTPYTATLAGRTLKGTWAVPRDYDTGGVGGEVTLELSGR